MDGNGSEETRVRFGDRDWQSIPAAWAELMLREWRRTQPAAFGKMLARVATQDGGRS